MTSLMRSLLMLFPSNTECLNPQSILFDNHYFWDHFAQSFFVPIGRFEAKFLLCCIRDVQADCTPREDAEADGEAGAWREVAEGPGGCRQAVLQALTFKLHFDSEESRRAQR